VDEGVGSKLRAARTRRKLSLQDAEEATKIRARYLGALEDEDWDQLPGDTYARAFIRTYAALLGLDGDQLAEEQRRGRGASRPGEKLPRVDPRPRRVVGHKGRRPSFPSWLMTGIVVALVAVALVAVVLIGGGDQGEGGEAHHPPAPHVGQAVPVR
jgi:cytoskeleton protein RodZ